MIRVIELRQTCPSHPAQWEGRTADGRAVYVRYRWGSLQVGVGASLSDAVNDLATFDRKLGDDYDGVLSYPELQIATAGMFAWP